MKYYNNNENRNINGRLPEGQTGSLVRRPIRHATGPFGVQSFYEIDCTGNLQSNNQTHKSREIKKTKNTKN